MEGKPLLFSSKYITTYGRLFANEEKIPPKDDQFWLDLFVLDVDFNHLENRLLGLTVEDCTVRYKPVLNGIISACLHFSRSTPTFGNSRNIHALETFSVVIRCILSKGLSGWEVIEVFAGSAAESDKVFDGIVTLVDEGIVDETTPAATRHRILQLALSFVCGIQQLSPGAYFLRKNLFPSISKFIMTPETEQYTFEAVLFITILANFHKSDAAKLNPYIQSLKASTDVALFRKICWASNFSIHTAVKAYQEISDDSPPTLSASFGSFMSSMLPTRAFTSKVVDTPRELFKNQPIEASVVLLPVFEFLRYNPPFSKLLVEQINEPPSTPNQIPPLLFTLLTLSSYLLTHASSTSTPRAIAYANLSLNTLLVLVENADIMEFFCEPLAMEIRLCRQRMPLLDMPSPKRPPLCALFDCCVLWLRHNLHIRLEISSYITCIRVCHRAIWYLQSKRVRLEYEWQVLWSALFDLLKFLVAKHDTLAAKGETGQLAKETILLLDLALVKSELFLPGARPLHEYVYELVRASPIIKRQAAFLQAAPPGKRRAFATQQSPEILARMLTVTEFYEDKIAQSGSRTVESAMQVVAKEIDKDGLFLIKDQVIDLEKPSKRSEDMLGFGRFACNDGLALMP